MKYYTTEQAKVAEYSETTTIYNESQTSCLTITIEELDEYERQQGFGIEDITPDWLLFDLLMWVRNPSTKKAQ